MTQNKTSLFRSGAIILAAFLWAVGGVFFIPQLFHIPVLLVVFIQHLIPTFGIILFILLQPSLRAEIQNIRRHTWLNFLWVAFFGGFLGTYAITQAFFGAYSAQISVSPIFFLQKLQPIFAVLSAVFILKESLSKRFWTAGIIALVGSYGLTFGLSLPEINTDNQTLISALWALLAAFSWGISTTISKKSLQTVSPLIGTFMRFFLTMSVCFVLILILPQVHLSAIQDISNKEWNLFVIIAVTTGGLALWLYYWGLKKISATHSAIYEMSMPLFALTLEQFLAPFILSGFERPVITITQIISGFILLGGIGYLITQNKKSQNFSNSRHE
ncbi:EamA family transporter [bacterium DOLZORAL124_38_8]|nr:MAG: EamA family transporter [bacterium DOLZORAL124_38_8]